MKKPEWDEASDARTSAARIDELCTHADPEVRRRAAMHDRTTAARRDDLSRDPEWSVRWGAARARLTLARLDEMANDVRDTVAWAALANPRCPAATLDRAAADTSLALDGLVQVARHRNTGSQALTKLRAHPDPTVRAEAKR